MFERLGAVAEESQGLCVWECVSKGEEKERREREKEREREREPKTASDEVLGSKGFS